MELDLNLLKKIQTAATDAVNNLYKERLAETPFNRSGVNWADVSCVYSAYQIDSYGDKSIRVVISEASPNETSIINHVSKALLDSGMIPENFDLEVETEW